MPKYRPDYITVRLSDQALQQLGPDATVNVTNLHMQYCFHGSAGVEVLRRPEWDMLQHHQFNGVPLFQEDGAVAQPALVQSVAQPTATEHTTAESHEG